MSSVSAPPCINSKKWRTDHPITPCTTTSGFRQLSTNVMYSSKKWRTDHRITPCTTTSGVRQLSTNVMYNSEMAYRDYPVTPCIKAMSGVRKVSSNTLHNSSKRCTKKSVIKQINPLNPELNPICYLLALLAHHFLHVSRIRVKSLTLR